MMKNCCVGEGGRSGFGSLMIECSSVAAGQAGAEGQKNLSESSSLSLISL